ncbi:hypothetical protein CAP39_10625 [Sphingomonas sp. IBVSS1]|nr:hypothetical protein CAP39_10625 [Sphingomonas sp. IBVSS1]
MFGTFDWKFRVGFSDKRKITATMGCLSYVSDFNAGSNNAVSCNLGNSFDWVGITFTDENGDPVTTDPITSASGQNYNVAFSPMPAVPEPASWAMMIAGFGLIGAVARRRRLLRA